MLSIKGVLQIEPIYLARKIHLMICSHVTARFPQRILIRVVILRLNPIDAATHSRSLAWHEETITEVL